MKPSELAFLICWGLGSLWLVSTLTFHTPADIAFAIALSALVTASLIRLLPGRRSFMSPVIGGGVAVLLCVTLDIELARSSIDFARVSWGVGASACTTLLVLSRRPLFSLLTGVALVGGLAATSYLKYQYTGVPLLWLDLHLAANTWEFLVEMQGAAALVILLTFGSAAAVLWRIEHPVVFGHYRQFWLVGLVSGLALSSSAFATARISSGADILRTGWDTKLPDPWAVFLGSVKDVSALQEPLGYDPAICCFGAMPDSLRATRVPNEKPHVVVILEESTFSPEALAGWAPRSEFFEQAYPLEAEVVGGGTWMAEYAFLHGVPPSVYGPGGLYINLLGPGRVEGRLPVFLKQQGYSTTTIYPVHRHFYGASAFHRSLGMDQFLDCRDVPGCPGNTWSTINDSRFFAVAEKTLRDSKGPAFVFLPTIRQHSPHVGSASAAINCADWSDVQCKVLSAYSDRLSDSVSEFNGFLSRLGSFDHEVVVLAFGDHIPADVARHFPDSNFPFGKKRTFFTVWSNRRGYLTHSLARGVGEPRVIHNAYLDLILARAAGFDSRYFAAKEAALRACSGRYCPSERGGQ